MPRRSKQQIRESEAAHPVGLLGDVVVLRNGARAARSQYAGHRAECACCAGR